MACNASASASTSERSAASKWCVNRSAVFGPMPGSLPNSVIRRAIAPTGSVPTIRSRFSRTRLVRGIGFLVSRGLGRLQSRQAQTGRHAKTRSDLAGFFGNLPADLVEGLVGRRSNQVFQKFAVLE